jgi:hypothetical protein
VTGIDRRQDRLWTAGVGFIALAAYVRTLAPGLTSDPDSAMFQFIGRVLGVAHNPGYPLYVLLTHAFSYLPIGSLAYRINLFSALCGAIAVSLTFLASRRLGCGRLVSAGAALGFAFGSVFWSQAVVAEVYTLNAAIVAGMMVALLTWSETRRPRWYYTAVALFAAGLGHHTTIVGFAPGMALFVLLVDRRFVLRLRTLTVTAGILTAGLLQYLFILLRSSQPDAYVESRATTLGELAKIVLGRQFQDRLFAFGWHELLVKRTPMFVKTIFLPDMTVVGAALGVIGIVWLLRRRVSAAILLATGAVAIVAFALSYSVIDTAVFLIPALLVAWLLAAVGGAQVVSWLPARAWIGGASIAFCLIPAWLLATNFKASDRSRDTRAAIELDRLFQALPDRASLVSEDFIADRMVMAKLLGDDAAHGRHIELADPDSNLLRLRLEAGQAVFAFGKSAQTLRFDGLDVGFEPLRLIEGPLDRFLSRLPDGAIVAIGVPAAQGGAFTATAGTSLETIGGPSDLTVLAGLNLAVVGVRARTGAAIQAARLVTTLDAAAGKQVGETGRMSLADIHVHVEPFEASIGQGDRELVRSTEGIVMAVWSADGHLADTFVLEAADRFQVPIRPGPLSAYKLRGTWTRERIAADSWTDVSSSLRSGSVMVRVASGEKLVLYLGDDAPMAPRVYDWSERARVDVSSGSTVASAGLAGDLPGDLAVAFNQDTHVYRIEIDAFGAAVSVQLALGGLPVHALGRVTRVARAHAADAFRVDVGGLLKSPDRRSEVLQMGRDAQAQLIGHGWSAVDRDDRGPFRWMTATEARVILPLSRSSARHIRVQSLREARSPDTTMRLRVNTIELTPQPLQPGWHVYEWAVPQGCMIPGINEASVVVDRLAETATGKAGGKGIAVSDVRVIHD